MYYSMLKPPCSNFRVITANVRLSEFLGFLFTVFSADPEIHGYRNDPKFSDRYAWANSADPDQTGAV